MVQRSFVISLVRHGETLANRDKIMQGQLDTHLSDLGKKQAQLIAVRLKNEKFTHMFSSDLARASETAQAIAEANVVSKGNLVLDRRLRERCFGRLEGKPLSELRKDAETAKIPMQDYLPEGAETMAQLADRAKDFFDELCLIMAKFLLPESSSSSLEVNDSNHQVTQTKESNVPRAASNSHDSQRDTEANPYQPLHIDVPACKSVEPQKNYAEGNNPSSSHQCVSSMIQCDSSSSKNESSVSPAGAGVLIVSHGLLLRELKKLILNSYVTKFTGEKAKEAFRVCPNTGLSRFTMSICIQQNKVRVICEKIHIISDASHLVTSKENLVSQAHFQGAL